MGLIPRKKAISSPHHDWLDAIEPVKQQYHVREGTHQPA
jgi:hypothetical protein